MASANPFPALPIVPPSAERPVQQAFVLRLSDDSLEALRELILDGQGDGMELELGMGETLLHIPNHSPFNLTPAELKPSTEFVSHSSPSSPYFLHSTASTRYTVRQTTVSAATKNKLRLGTEQAAKERADRKIIQLDHDPLKASKGKGKAAAAVSSSTNLPAHMRIKPPSTGSAGSAGSRGSSPAPRVLTPGGSPAMSSSATGRAGSRDGTAGGSKTLRTRVVQLLALGPMSLKDLVLKVKSREEDVLEVLGSVAKPPTSTTRLYQLRPKSFTELDIFGWKPYSSSDRAKVLAVTQHAFDHELHLSKDAPERRILNPDFVKSPAKPLYASSALGTSGSGLLGLGIGMGSGSKRSASPLPPASPVDDTSSSTSSSAPLSKATGGRKGAAPSTGSLTSTTTLKGKKKATDVVNPPKIAVIASKRKLGAQSSDDNEEDGEISEPKPSSSALLNGNGISSDNKRRRTTDPHSSYSESSPLKHSTSSTSTSEPANPLGKPHLSTSTSSSTGHVPTPYTTRPNTPSIPEALSSTHHSSLSKSTTSSAKDHHRPRKASPIFTSSSGSSTSSSPPSSPDLNLHPLDLPDSPRALRKRFKALWPEYEGLNESLGREMERSEGVLSGRVNAEGEEGMAGKGAKTLKEVKGEVRRRRLIHRELEEIKGRLKGGSKGR